MKQLPQAGSGDVVARLHPMEELEGEPAGQ